ncbi:hypothetical protein F4810DRAFT_664419 [Camillea tinctor]|nr:hypothetical protein F4810DRAFT_664419 [Camillea tinctor]
MSTIATTQTEAPRVLVPGFEIRPLTMEHLDWVKAIMMHTNLFSNPVWSKVLAHKNRTEIAYRMFEKADYIVTHGLESGLSYGVFDANYVYKRPETSAPTGGKLYWDHSDNAATGDDLVEQMDFPLVSVALAYDGFNAMDPARFGCVSYFPAFEVVLDELEKRDTRSGWKPTGPGQVVYRNATSTRTDYAGKGLMKMQAHMLMRMAAEKGFRAIKIECYNEILPRVWANPPPPFRGEIVSSVHTHEIKQVGEDGQEFQPLKAADQKLTRVWVDLV